MPPEPITSVHEHAVLLVRGGVSIIPIARDGTKRPEGRRLPKVWDPTEGREVATWNPYKERLPTEAELKMWFGGQQPYGLASVGGQVSGGLETLDFDRRAEEVFPAWCEAVEGEAPGLLAKLSIARTPRPGFQPRYRCTELPIPGNMQLAREPQLDPSTGKIALDPKTGKEIWHTTIETRGEGGYALLPGCPAECHETGRLYRHHAGPPAHQLQTISAKEREVLIAAARAFDRRPQDEPPPAAGGCAPGTGAGQRPGDDFNRRGPDWAEILEPHGWSLAGAHGKERRWRRPGKGAGWSATTGVCVSKSGGHELLNVFSSSADPFEPGTYSKFRAWALLNHKGQWGAATQALVREGYGQPQQQARPAPPPPAGEKGAAPAAAAAAEPKRPASAAEAWEKPIPIGDAPRPEPFPLDVLPAPLAGYCQEVAAAVHCPLDFVAVPLLALAGGAIGNARRLAITTSHTQGAVVFAVTIGRPSSGKSPALDLLVAPLEATERAWRQHWEAECKAAGDEEKPHLNRLLLDDTTTERMAELLQDNARGLLMIRDEAAAIVSGLNQYKSGKGHDRQVYLKLWSQGTIRVDRKTNADRPLVVYRPFVAIVGGIQPSVVDTLRGESKRPGNLDDGFLDRFLFVYPEDLTAIGERWLEVSEGAVAAWAHAVARLLSLQLAAEGDGPPRPVLLKLSPGAREAWRAFTDAHAAELNDPDFPDHLRSRWGKLFGYCGRFALILDCLGWAFSEVEPVYNVAPVRRESLEGAVKLVGYFKSHARRLTACLDADPRLQLSKLVLRLLARRPDPRTEEARNTRPAEGFTRRDLYLHLRRHVGRPEALDAPLKLLVECRYLRPVPAAAGVRPGPQPERFETNPLWTPEIKVGSATTYTTRTGSAPAE